MAKKNTEKQQEELRNILADHVGQISRGYELKSRDSDWIPWKSEVMDYLRREWELKTPTKTESEEDISPVVSSVYKQESDNNYKVFSEMVQRFRPDIWVIMDILDQTGVDPFILIKIIRQINNIAMGSGYGQVVTVIEKGNVRYVRGEDVDKIELPVFKNQT